MLKKIILTSMIAGLAIFAAPAAFDDTPAPAPKKGRIAERKERQQKRIGEGVENGSLTAKEASKLETREANLNKTIRQERKANGGTLTPKEKAKVEARQDRISKDIYKQKHDKQKQ